MSRHKPLWVDASCYFDTIQNQSTCMSRYITCICRHILNFYLFLKAENTVFFQRLCTIHCAIDCTMGAIDCTGKQKMKNFNYYYFLCKQRFQGNNTGKPYLSDALIRYLQNTILQRQRQIFFVFWLEVNYQRIYKIHN